MTHQAPDRVVQETQAAEEADHAEEVAEQDLDVVLAGGDRVVVEALGVDRVPDQLADEESDDPAQDPGEQVEAEQAPPRAGRTGWDGNRAHPPLLCGSGKYVVE